MNQTIRLTVPAVIVLTLAAGTHVAAQPYDPPIWIATGDEPVTLAVGNVSSDGFISSNAVDDIIIGNFLPPSIRVLRNTGGGFVSLPAHTVGGSVFGLATGLLDSDGWHDVVTANRDGNSISVLLNDQSGFFLAPMQVDYALPVGPAVQAQPMAVALLDLELDGDEDIVVAGFATGTVYWWLNDGAGGFSTPTPSEAAVTCNVAAGAAFPTSLVAYDFDDDGDKDIVVTNAGAVTDQVTILMNSNGVLEPVCAGPWSPATRPQSPRQVVAAFVDCDDTEDLVFAHEGNLLSVRYGVAGGGFSSWLNISTSAPVSSVAVVDFNNDLAADLVATTATGSRLLFYENVGGRSFRPAGELVTGSGLSFVAAGDWDGTSPGDLAVADGAGGSVGTLSGVPSPFAAGGVRITRGTEVVPGTDFLPEDKFFTSEYGGISTIGVTLGCEPTGPGPVIVSIASTSSNGVPFPSALGFFPSNWNIPQKVTLVGVNDLAADGNTDFTFTTTVSSVSDPRFDGAGPTLAATNFDGECMTEHWFCVRARGGKPKKSKFSWSLEKDEWQLIDRVHARLEIAFNFLPFINRWATNIGDVGAGFAIVTPLSPPPAISTCFFVAIGEEASPGVGCGGSGFSLCVGKRNKTPSCCLPQDGTCYFNPYLVQMPPVETDCDFNGLFDGWEIVAGSTPDCNVNGVPDECDIQSGTSQDQDFDTVPDECGDDCNGDGIGDLADIALGGGADCNSNGVLDDCDILFALSEDCNSNGVPDECEECTCTPSLCPLSVQPNGVGDACEIAADPGLDLNTNGVIDSCETDCNVNGIPDAGDLAAGTSADCNGNQVPDDCEIQGTVTHNCCATGHGAGCSDPDIEFCVCAADTDCCTSGWDSICAEEVIQLGCGVCQYFGTDCNGNAVLDECELAGNDCNNNAVPDECDVLAGGVADCNVNSVPDACDIAGNTAADCNSNGIPDECDLYVVPAHDCCDTAHGTGCSDAGIEATVCALDPFCCVVAWDSVCVGRAVAAAGAVCFGTSADLNLTGVPDACEPGDFDGDADVDLIDFAQFQQCYTDAGGGITAAECRFFDHQPDDDVDLHDYAIFESFVTGP